jgi:hypothetical protein
VSLGEGCHEALSKFRLFLNPCHPLALLHLSILEISKIPSLMLVKQDYRLFCEHRELPFMILSLAIILKTL